MRLPRRIVRKIFATLGITLLVAGCAYYYAITPHHSSAPPESAEGLLDRADTLAWGNRWADALPLSEKGQHGINGFACLQSPNLFIKLDGQLLASSCR